VHCRSCGNDVDAAFRFCPWCAAPLRRKLVEFFPAHRRDQGRALRVSWYFDEDPHVRFSVWDEDGRAAAAVSLPEDETERLGRLILRRRMLRRRRVGERLLDRFR
jgi:hypothetical protein